MVVLFVVFSFVPTFYELYNRNKLPEIRAFELVHNFPTDYNFYLSRIRQGLEGRLTVVERYTSEPHRGSFIHVFYSLLGWIGKFSRVPVERVDAIYHAARLVFSIVLLWVTSEFVRKSFGGGGVWTLIAFLLALTASTWPKLLAFDNNGFVPLSLATFASWRFGGFMPWWSLMDSLQRITFIPHLLVGQALIVFLITALWDEATMKKADNWLFLGLLAFILGLVFPPGLLFIGVVAVVMIGMQLLLVGVRTISQATTYIGPRGLVVAMGAPALLYLSLMTSIYPWKRLVEFDIINPLPFDYGEYFLAVGYVLPFGLIGLIIALWNREKYLYPAVAWIIAWLALLGIFNFVPAQSPLRFSEMLPHVPLGILTAYLFYSVWKRRVSLVISHLSFVIPTMFIIVGLGVMYSSWLWQRDFIDHKMRATYPLVPTGSYVLYPMRDFMDAIRFVGGSTPGDSVILSDTTAGNYIPAYSGRTVYVGHANTVRAEEKVAIVRGFFSGVMSPEEARVFLTRERIGEIYYGPQEREIANIGDLRTPYPFLTQEYKNTFVTVYKIQ